MDMPVGHTRCLQPLTQVGQKRCRAAQHVLGVRPRVQVQQRLRGDPPGEKIDELKNLLVKLDEAGYTTEPDLKFELQLRDENM